MIEMRIGDILDLNKQNFEKKLLAIIIKVVKVFLETSVNLYRISNKGTNLELVLNQPV